MEGKTILSCGIPPCHENVGFLSWAYFPWEKNWENGKEGEENSRQRNKYTVYFWDLEIWKQNLQTKMFSFKNSRLCPCVETTVFMFQPVWIPQVSSINVFLCRWVMREEEITFY